MILEVPSEKGLLSLRQLYNTVTTKTLIVNSLNQSVKVKNKLLIIKLNVTIENINLIPIY